MFIEGYQDIGLLALRVALGAVSVAHGWTKIKNPSAFAKNMGLSFITGLFVSIGEFFGGLGVLFGLFTQIAAFGPFIVMTGALYYHIFAWKQQFVSKDGKGFEFPFTLWIIALALIFLGAGAYSMDAYLGFF